MSRETVDRFRLTRRSFLGYVGPAVAATSILSLPRLPLFAEPNSLLETPADDEGPFYRSGAPDRSDFRRKGAGVAALTVFGVARAEDGKALAGVVFDLWHADPNGSYDNDSKEFRYRGKVKTDAAGKFSFTTDVPGRYGLGLGRSRPRHVHVKLSGKGLHDLTTQMYFGVRPAVDAPEELVVRLTWTGEDATRLATGTWNPVLARKPAPAPAPAPKPDAKQPR